MKQLKLKTLELKKSQKLLHMSKEISKRTIEMLFAFSELCKKVQKPRVKLNCVHFTE